ncbi:MAG: MFS transporter, partial [Acidimicrobiales bacterium]|nr:MFS transporter [Acidimicrobiales bacterium]
STIVFSRLSDRFGQIPFIRLGTFLQIIAMTWQFTKLGTEVDYWSDFAPGLLLYGTGWGMSSPLQNSLALASIDERYFGELNGIFNTVRYTAGAIGTAVVFALLTVDTGPESLSHYDATLMFFAISAAVAFVVSWVPLNDRSAG